MADIKKIKIGNTEYNVKDANAVTSVNNVQPVNGNVSLNIPTVDQTYSSSSANAQSGVAISDAKFVRNTATGTGSLTIAGSATNKLNSVNIGGGSSASGAYSTAIGIGADAGAKGVAIGVMSSASEEGTAIGYQALAGSGAIQIGKGTNSTVASLSIGFSALETNYQLLDGSTGLIPDARISSNIARTNAIPTESTVSGWGFTKNTGTVTSVNNATPDTNGNVTIQTGGREPAEIITSTIPRTDAELHLLDGALINGSGIYSAFVDYMASIYDASANYFCSEADWQTSVTNYGACDKYVYDSTNNTVRLPKKASEHGGLIKSYSSGTSWYRIYADGWCEQGGVWQVTALLNTIPLNQPYNNNNYTITTTVRNADTYTTATEATAQVYNIQTTSFNIKTCQIVNQGSGFNASYIPEVHWQASGYTDISSYQQNPLYEYIVLATTTKTDIQVDIDEVITDLNSKADVDLSNVPTSKSILSESYVNGTSWYRVYSDGWCEQGGYVATGNNVTYLKPYLDTNYTLVASGISTSTNPTAYRQIMPNAISETGFTATRGSGVSLRWYACGYIN